MDLKGKKLLILGGTSASLDLVRSAKEMGIYTVVTDDCPNRVAKDIADEKALISTTDIPALCKLIKEKKIDGVFCGPSEFNLRNVIKVCEESGLPCYTDTKTWDKCANKDVFKSYCREYDVDCAPEYSITLNTSFEELEKIDYPIIIKPVDGSSSAGISVCERADEVRVALEKAYSASKSKKIIAEKFIENNGEIFSVRYLLKDGEAYPYFLMDTYVADPVHKTSLISAFTCAPSKYLDYYMENMDMKVRKMLKGMGLKNGTAFIQSLPYNGKIYFHEMGYRLSGGFIYKLTQPLMGVNDFKMMIRLALGDTDAIVGEIEKIDISCKGKFGAQLMAPLNIGTISKIEGVEDIKNHPCVCDYLQYYNVGDTIENRVIGTLGQHFCRITFLCDSHSEMISLIDLFQKTLCVYDENNKKMNSLQFNTERLPF